MKKKFLNIYIHFVNLFSKKNIILFESHSDFCDSSKKLYDTCLEYDLNKKYKLVWLVENKDNFANYKISNVKFINIYPHSFIDFFKKLYYYSFAKYCFYTHRMVGFPNNKGQVRYFLNHSSFPIKNLVGRYEDYETNTYIEVTSKLSAKYRSIVLGGGLDRMKILGLPRNDYLFENKNILFKMGLNSYNKVIIWMPTFKHHKCKDRNDYKYDVDSDISLLTENYLSQINHLLVKYNSVMIIKFHPEQDMEFVNSINLSNIITMVNEDLDKKNIALYNLLGEANALITDFSSVYFDYLLLNRPIGFELTDKKNYESGQGFLMENPLDFMPGKKIYNVDDFMQFISDVCNNNDSYSSERQELLDQIHKYKDGKSSERILKFLNLI